MQSGHHKQGGKFEEVLEHFPPRIGVHSQQRVSHSKLQRLAEVAAYHTAFAKKRALPLKPAEGENEMSNLRSSGGGRMPRSGHAKRL